MSRYLGVRHEILIRISRVIVFVIISELMHQVVSGNEVNMMVSQLRFERQLTIRVLCNQRIREKLTTISVLIAFLRGEIQ